MSRKIPKKAKTQKSRKLEVNTKAVRTLRTLDDKEAFYFYEAVGKPTGECARSLFDFLKKVKAVKLEILLFHLQRKDFQNWIGKTLGDSELARRIGKIVPSHSDDIRTKMYSIVEKRIKELAEASPTLMINTDLVLASQGSTS